MYMYIYIYRYIYIWELAGHGVHVALPASALNVPATHCPHAPPSGPVHPALHRQAPAATLPGSESEFSGHSAHAEDHTSTSQRLKP